MRFCKNSLHECLHFSCYSCFGQNILTESRPKKWQFHEYESYYSLFSKVCEPDYLIGSVKAAVRDQCNMCGHCRKFTLHGKLGKQVRNCVHICWPSGTGRYGRLPLATAGPRTCSAITRTFRFKLFNFFKSMNMQVKIDVQVNI